MPGGLDHAARAPFLFVWLFSFFFLLRLIFLAKDGALNFRDGESFLAGFKRLFDDWVVVHASLTPMLDGMPNFFPGFAQNTVGTLTNTKWRASRAWVVLTTHISICGCFV